MNWTDLPRNPTLKVLGAALILLALTIGVTGLIAPWTVRRIFVGWMVLAFPIGWLVSLIMIAVMYFLVLTPVALFFRLVGRDALTRKIEPAAATYWVDKESPADSRRYFQQY